jgi:hypothetical protein
VLSISRRSIARDLEDARVIVDPRDRRRCRELPVSTSEGDLSDLAPAEVLSAASTSGKAQLEAIQKAANDHHGHALTLMFWAIGKLGAEAQSKAERWVAGFESLLPPRLKQQVPGATIRQLGALYATGRLAAEAGIVSWRQRRILRAVTKCLEDACRQSRPPSMKLRIKNLLGDRLRALDLPRKIHGQELSHFPAQGFRTVSSNSELWWINADHFRSWFSDRPAEVEVALRLLFAAGRLVLPVVYGADNFPGVFKLAASRS